MVKKSPRFLLLLVSLIFVFRQEVNVTFGVPSGKGPLPTTPSWLAESNQADAHFGSEVRSVGDVNGDGYDDVLISAENYANGQPEEGKVFLWYGSASGLGDYGNSSNADWSYESNQAYARLGAGGSTGLGVDVNGDGYADVLLSAKYYDTDKVDAGQVYLFYGSANGLDTSPDWMAEGSQTGGLFGVDSGTAGDVNGDAYEDVIIGTLN